MDEPRSDEWTTFPLRPPRSCSLLLTTAAVLALVLTIVGLAALVVNAAT